MSERAKSTSASTPGPAYALEFERPIVKMEHEIERLEASQAETGRDYSEVIGSIREQLRVALEHAYGNLSAWELVQVARHPKRPLLRDYIRMLAKDFCELHGDKLYGNDGALVTGFARIAGHKVMLIGHDKGRDTRDKLRVNFGCAHPEGYRKALQKMQLAAKFKVPVVCLVDTPGAYPGIGAEERGIASAIAKNLMEMSRLPTPIVSVVIGEGGSGGALGIAVADHVAVMQHSYYSVISPEGCAAILWKSREHAAKAAEALNLTPEHLKKLELIDTIIEEPLGGAHRAPEAAAKALESWISRSLRELGRVKPERLLKRRFDRWRNIGSFIHKPAKPEVAKSAKTRGGRSRGAQSGTPVTASQPR